MTRSLAVILPGLTLVLGACAGAPSPAGPSARPLVVPLGGDPGIYAPMVAERAGRAEVVYLGELHDSAPAHVIQVRILQALLASGGRPALAFEMVETRDQAGLEAAVRSGEAEAEVEQRLRWHDRGWPAFSMYWPLFELARRYRLPVAGIDLDPALVRRINREGVAAVPGDQGDLASRLPPDPALDRALTRRIQAAHCNLLPEAHIPRMVESWYARNVTIARRLAEALGQAPQVVVIIGRGHQSPGGVPAQLAAIRPGTRQLVVAVAEVAPGESPKEALGADGANAVWLIPGAERPDPCRGLRQRQA